MRRALATAGLALVALTAACGSSGPSAGTSAAPAKILVVTTSTELTDFAKEVGGSNVRVYGILKANVDPHDYEPSPADIDALARADVIVKNGVGLEKWFDDTVKSASPKGEVVDASGGVQIRAGTGEEEAAGDPHIWHNPLNAVVMATHVEQALERADPAHISSYQQALAAYTAKLTQLDTDIKSKINSLTNKKLVTNHDALGYYVERYGLEFVGSIIPSFDTSAELSAQDVSSIVAKIKSAGVKAVFSETSLPRKTAESIGREAGVRVVAGETALYGDTLGPPGSDGDTYLKMEAHNTRVIVDNLS